MHMELDLETGSFTIPTVKGFGKKSFAYNGCVLWNTLPKDIKSIQRHQAFKLAIKSHVLDIIDF